MMPSAKLLVLHYLMLMCCLKMNPYLNEAGRHMMEMELLGSWFMLFVWERLCVSMELTCVLRADVVIVALCC